MKRTLFLLSFFFLISGILGARYVIRLTTFKTGDRLLLPVRVEKIEKDAFPFIARIRYYNFIPVEELEKERGVVVVRRLEDGRIDFVANAEGQKRHSRELILKYEVVSPPFFMSEQKEPDIRFAASSLRFFKQEFSAAAVRYAVVYVNASGEAYLAGLADATGSLLVRGLALKAFHIL